jgi:hypothetical protein
MNLNNLKVQVSVSLNGATVTPTSTQLGSIKDFIINNLFEAQNTEKKERRPYKRKVHRAHWTTEQINRAIYLRTVSTNSLVGIAKILNKEFGTKRTEKAVGLLFHRLSRSVQVDKAIDEALGEVPNGDVR